MKHTLSEARQAKKKLAEQLSGLESVTGIGISTRDNDYALQVFLESRVPEGTVPDSVEGIPVTVDVIGKVLAY